RGARRTLLSLRAGQGRCERLPVGDDERRRRLAARADDDHLADVLALLDETLDELRGYVLAVRELEQLLLAVGDEEVAALVRVAHVAGLEPAVLREDGGGLVRVF